MVIIDNAYKIRLIKNSKRPHRAKWDYMKTQEKINGNYGILTGEQNDIIAIDIDFYDKNGITPLHYAAWGTAEKISILLEAGADKKAKTNSGKTAFELAKDNEDLFGTETYYLLKNTNE